MTTPDLRSLFQKALLDVDPGALVEAYLQQNPPAEENITLLAVGKSAGPMALAANAVLGSRISQDVVVMPASCRPEADRYPPHWLTSSHPQMSPESIVAGTALLSAAQKSKGRCLCLISGGGSALAALPAPGLSWQEKSTCIDLITSAGAPIQDINTVRKHLSSIKGGRLAAIANSTMTTLLISDVIGDSLHSIASGPTLVDPSTYQDALEILLQRLGTPLPSDVISAVKLLTRGAQNELPETPKQLPRENRAVLLAGISALAEKAIELARGTLDGVNPIQQAVAGNMDQAIVTLLPYTSRPGLWIGYGEPTISLPTGGIGRGGRAQHMALLLAREIQGLPVRILVAGSDGVDGNSDAAGAVVDGGSYEKIRAQNLSPDHSLENFDSNTALSSIDALITTGRTGVNHADIFMIHVQE